MHHGACSSLEDRVGGLGLARKLPGDSRGLTRKTPLTPLTVSNSMDWSVPAALLGHHCSCPRLTFVQLLLEEAHLSEEKYRFYSLNPIPPHVAIFTLLTDTQLPNHKTKDV